MFSSRLASNQSKVHIQPRQSRTVVKKADLLEGTTQRPLQLQNKSLLSLDGGGLRGIISGMMLCCTCLQHIGFASLRLVST